ncbi:hypothetical protein B0H11DRAFT_455740 [Mycena galericulata]|nr:hypothetical protein B0H11DRAFT_455740 [Mycena galericulata]
MSLVLLMGYLSWIMGLSESCCYPCLKLVHILFFTNFISNQRTCTVFTGVACQVVVVGTATKALNYHYHVYS